MQIPFEIALGWRYTRAGRAMRRNGFISFISGASMLGIALGVAALIIVLSVMNGFQKEVPSDVATLIRFDNAVYSLSVTSSDADILAATIPFNASSFEAFLVEKYPPICCLSLFSISFQVRLFHTFGKLVQLYIIRVKFV